MPTPTPTPTPIVLPPPPPQAFPDSHYELSGAAYYEYVAAALSSVGSAIARLPEESFEGFDWGSKASLVTIFSGIGTVIGTFGEKIREREEHPVSPEADHQFYEDTWKEAGEGVAKVFLSTGVDLIAAGLFDISALDLLFWIGR